MNGDMLYKLACLLLIVGGLNWGAIAVAKMDLVDKATAMVHKDNAQINRAIYALVGLAAVLVAYKKLTK
jgi:uncharacterized membrane protein YuzA (DUF378 family)